MVDFGKALKQQAVFGHGVDDARQRKHGTHQAGRQTEQRADADDPTGRRPSELLECVRNGDVRILKMKNHPLKMSNDIV